MLCSQCSRNLRLFDPTKVVVNGRSGDRGLFSTPSLPILHNRRGESNECRGGTWDLIGLTDSTRSIPTIDITSRAAEGFWPRLTFHVPMKSYHLRERELVCYQQEHRQTDDTKVIKRTGEEATRRCHFADRTRRMTILFSWKESEYWSFGDTSRLGVIPGSIREIIDTRVMSLWQRRDRVVQERKIKGEIVRGIVCDNFFFHFIRRHRHFYWIFNWDSPLVCAEEDEKETREYRH